MNSLFLLSNHFIIFILTAITGKKIVKYASHRIIGGLFSSGVFKQPGSKAN